MGSLHAAVSRVGATSADEARLHETQSPLRLPTDQRVHGTQKEYVHEYMSHQQLLKEKCIQDIIELIVYKRDVHVHVHSCNVLGIAVF